MILRFSQGFAVIRERLAGALEEQGLRVVAQVPTSEILSRAGYNVPGIHQVFFFRPDFMNEIIMQNDGKDLIATQSNAIMLAPLKAVIFEEGAETAIRFQNPTMVFQSYPKLAHLALDMKARMNHAIERLKQTEGY